MKSLFVFYWWLCILGMLLLESYSFPTMAKRFPLGPRLSLGLTVSRH